NGNIELSGDLDFFSFMAAEGHIYRFTCTPSTTLGYCSVRLMSAAGVVFAQSGTSGAAAYEAPAASPIYVEGKAYFTGALSPYTYGLEDLGPDDSGDPPAVATAIAVGASASAGNIETGGDADVFSFSATANHIYRFTCVPSPQLYGCALRLLDSGGTALGSG